ncbi:hypothetical protein Tco_0519628 [Tanacetum coccineum]
MIRKLESFSRMKMAFDLCSTEYRLMLKLFIHPWKFTSESGQLAGSPSFLGNLFMMIRRTCSFIEVRARRSEIGAYLGCNLAAAACGHISESAGAGAGAELVLSCLRAMHRTYPYVSNIR